MSLMMKRRVVLGLGAALLAIALLVVGVGWEDVFESVRGASLSVYALAFVSVLGTLTFRTLSWDSVLRAVDLRIPRRRLFLVFCSATFLKYVTPYGQVAASPAIAYVLSQQTDGEYESDLAAVVSGDFLNYVPYYTFGGIGLLYLVFFTDRGLDLGGTFLAVPVILIVVVGTVALFWYRRRQIERAVLWLTDGVQSLVGRVSTDLAQKLSREQIRSRLDGFYTTLDLLATDRRAVLFALFWGHLGWIGLATALYLTLVALGPTAAVAFPIAMLTVALSKVGFLVPAPGGLGGVEFTLAAVLVVTAGLSTSDATAGALLFRVAAYWFPLGLGGLMTAGLSTLEGASEAEP